MKRIIFLLSLIFIIGCDSLIKKENSDKIYFRVNKGTEFLLTAFNIAFEDEISDEFRPCETEYTKIIEDNFSKHKNHPFIKYIYKKVNSGTDFASVGLLITDFNTMELDSNINAKLVKSKIYSDSIENFKRLALSFYKETDFEIFFEQNKKYYKKATENIQKQIKEDDLLNKIKNFYQDNRKGLEFIAFVELTNNNESQAVDFYDNYNQKIRAITLGNFCESSKKSNVHNEILDSNDYHGILCHEISHLYTSILLDKYIGNINDFKPLFNEKLDDVQIKNEIDHYIIFPLQGILTKRLYNDTEMDSIFKTKIKDVRKDIYFHLTKYNPKGKIPFEKYYKESIELIRNKAKIK